jgi:hypothetical protein
VFQWGQSNDDLACGDYDGDGKTDFGVQRGIAGYSYIYIYRSSDSSFYAAQLGLQGDLLVPGDYDHDGKNDIAVYRSGYFYIRRSSDAAFQAYQWGNAYDLPVPGDYTGNRGSDLCVFRRAEGNFYCLDPLSQGYYSMHWGIYGDSPVAFSNVH